MWVDHHDHIQFFVLKKSYQIYACMSWYKDIPPRLQTCSGPIRPVKVTKAIRRIIIIIKNKNKNIIAICLESGVWTKDKDLKKKVKKKKAQLLLFFNAIKKPYTKLGSGSAHIISFPLVEICFFSFTTGLQHKGTWVCECQREIMNEMLGQSTSKRSKHLHIPGSHGYFTCKGTTFSILLYSSRLRGKLQGEISLQL